MSGLYLPETQDDSIARDDFLNYSVSSNLDVLSTTLKETFYYNPFMSGMRNVMLRVHQKSGETIDKETWKNSEYYRDGLSYPESGLTKTAAMFIANRFDERAERQEILSRARGGFGMGAARFGTALVGSMLDPLNVAASFLPGAAVRTFVNARRAAKTKESVTLGRVAKESAFQTGKTGKRFVAGAGEGIAGAALVEPIILSTAELEQDKDYTLLDSFLNITIGGILGGGLHVVGGKFSDRLQKARKETLEAALKASIAQKTSGKPVQVQSILDADGNLKPRKYDPKNREPEFVNFADEKSMLRTLDDIDNEFKLNIKTKGVKFPDIISPRIKQPKRFSTWVREKGINSKDRMIKEFDENIKAGASFYKKNDGQGIDVLARDATEEGYFANEPTEGEFIDALRDDIDGNKRYSFNDEDAVTAYNQAQELKAYADENNINYKGVSDTDFMAQIKQNDEFNAYYEQMLGRVDADGLEPTLFDEAMTEQMEAMKRLDEAIEAEGQDIFSGPDPVARELELKELDIEEQQLLDEIEHYKKSNLITDTDAENIKIANEDVQRAETSFQSAAEAAARCLVR